MFRSWLENGAQQACASLPLTDAGGCHGNKGHTCPQGHFDIVIKRAFSCKGGDEQTAFKRQHCTLRSVMEFLCVPVISPFIAIGAVTPHELFLCSVSSAVSSPCSRRSGTVPKGASLRRRYRRALIGYDSSSFCWW